MSNLIYFDQIRNRLNATTEGPWHEADYNELGKSAHTWVESANWPICAMSEAPEHQANRIFIANAKTDVADLLDYVQWLQEKCRENDIDIDHCGMCGHFFEAGCDCGDYGDDS